MSIEKITSKITRDAEEKRNAVLAEAKEKTEEILAKAKAEADAYLAAEEARGVEMKETLISRRKSVADIDCRKLMLKNKQELLESCFDQAVTALASLPEAEYVDFLVNLAKATGEVKGVLIFNEKDKAAVGEKVCRQLAQAVKGEFSLSEETRNIAGGFVLQVGNVYLNNTIEALVAEHREAMSSEVAAKLFD